MELAPQLYQRLLAMDEHEARELADQYRQGHSLTELYDAVIIPALTMAEQDRHKGSLDAEREEFLFLTIREMMGDFSEKAQNGEHEFVTHQARTPSAERILCLPAHDEADEIAAAMLGQLLENAGYASMVFPLGSSVAGMLGLIEPGENDIICISAIQPFAFSHARRLNRELRTSFPRMRIAIGVWGFTGEMDRALLRFRPSAPDKLVRSLAEALDYVGVAAPVGTTEVAG